MTSNAITPSFTRIVPSRPYVNQTHPLQRRQIREVQGKTRGQNAIEEDSPGVGADDRGTEKDRQLELLEGGSQRAWYALSYFHPSRLTPPLQGLPSTNHTDPTCASYTRPTSSPLPQYTFVFHPFPDSRSHHTCLHPQTGLCVTWRTAPSADWLDSGFTMPLISG